MTTVTERRAMVEAIAFLLRYDGRDDPQMWERLRKKISREKFLQLMLARDIIRYRVAENRQNIFV